MESMARVVRVAGQSAAAKAGLKIDDQILSVEGAEIANQRSLSALLAKMKIGDSVAIKILRDGKEMELKAKLEPAPAPDYLGLSVTSNGTAAKVIEVARRSAAERAGIRRGDQIVSIQGSAVSDQKTLLSVLGKMKPGDTVKIKVMREGKEKDLEARLQQCGGPQRAGSEPHGQRAKPKADRIPDLFPIGHGL